MKIVLTYVFLFAVIIFLCLSVRWYRLKDNPDVTETMIDISLDPSQVKFPEPGKKYFAKQKTITRREVGGFLMYKTTVEKDTIEPYGIRTE